jgi:hypothetical protein
MAGCFGNSFVDRYMENQLYQHLNQEADFDNWYEKTSQLVTDEYWDNTGYCDWFEKTSLVLSLYEKNYSPEKASYYLVKIFEKLTNNLTKPHKQLNNSTIWKS